MASSDKDEIPRVREGALRRIIIGSLIGLLMLEVGLRILLGNFALVDVLQPAADDDVCVELQPGAEVRYTGWTQRTPPSTIRVNRRGGRGAALDQRPRPGVLRIAALGDGFTFGQGVDGADAFVQVASRALQREGVVNEVLNFAVPRTGPIQAVAHALDKVVPLEPDVVLLVVSADDLRPEDAWCTWRAPQPPVSVALKYLYTLRLGWQLLDKLQGPSLPPEATSAVGTPEVRFRAAVERLLAAGRENDFAVGVIFLTDRDGFTDPAYCDDCPAAHDLLEDIAVDTVDLSPVWRQLRADRSKSFLAGEGHLTMEGNLRVGLNLGGALAGWAELQRRATERSARLRP